MFAFYPHDHAKERIVWYGGASDILHYEVEVDDYKGDPFWIERECQTLNGVPDLSPCHTIRCLGTKELLKAMEDYYQYLKTV
jgi:hypothetical protein